MSLTGYRNELKPVWLVDFGDTLNLSQGVIKYVFRYLFTNLNQVIVATKGAFVISENMARFLYVIPHGKRLPHSSCLNYLYITLGCIKVICLLLS